MNDFQSFNDPHLRELGATLRFGAEDLVANRHGELSPAQIVQLQRDLNWQYGPIIGGLCVVILFLGLSGAFGPAAFLMLVALGLAAVLRLERERVAGKTPRATMLRLGSLGLTFRRLGSAGDTSTGRTYFPVADGNKVYASHRLYHVLVSKAEYRVFYAPFQTWGGYRMLSVEPLPSDAVPDKLKRVPGQAIKPKRSG